MPSRKALQRRVRELEARAVVDRPEMVALTPGPVAPVAARARTREMAERERDLHGSALGFAATPNSGDTGGDSSEWAIGPDADADGDTDPDADARPDPDPDARPDPDPAPWAGRSALDTSAIEAKADRYEAGDVDPDDGLGHGYITSGPFAGALNWGLLRAPEVVALRRRGYTVSRVASAPPRRDPTPYQLVAIEPPAT